MQAIVYCEYGALRTWIPLHGKNCQWSSGMHREIVHEFRDNFAYPISVWMKFQYSENLHGDTLGDVLRLLYIKNITWRGGRGKSTQLILADNYCRCEIEAVPKVLICQIFANLVVGGRIHPEYLPAELKWRKNTPK